MKFPKNFLHDKWVLALLAANIALSIVATAVVLLGVDTSESPLSIVSYRSLRGIQTSGSTSELYEFAGFAAIVTLVSVALSIKLYAHRRQLSLSVLGLNIVTLTLCMVVFNALTRTL